MKKILTPKKSNFIGKCTICGCIFLYEIEDINFSFVFMPTVKCPECGRMMNHPVQIPEYSEADMEKPE